MVKIVTGKINSLKTTRMVELYKKNHLGDGFVSIKRMIGSKVKSYSVEKLSTGERRLLIIRDEFNDLNEEIAHHIGPYQIIKNTLEFVENEIFKMIKEKTEPIYLDEIGILESEGKAFSHILRAMLNSNLDIVISVRDELLDKIIEMYEIKDYVILSE
jgi:nucleoside-triphosphatase THEP1